MDRRWIGAAVALFFVLAAGASAVTAVGAEEAAVKAQAYEALATRPPNPIPSGPPALPIFHRTLVIEHALPYPVVTRTDTALAQGVDEVAQAGQPGRALITVERLYFGGRLVASRIVREVVVKPAEPEVVLAGAAEVWRGSYSGPYQEALQVVASGYWADPSWSNGRTATGVPVHVGSVAVDPSVIPLGSRLYIPGYGYGVADDTGGAIVGHRIDLYFPSNSAALAWGMRAVTVYILGR
jgi:3D (Asp-Asp-Asp) domain-containing protein